MRTLSIHNVLAAIDDDFQPVNTVSDDDTYNTFDADVELAIAQVFGIKPDVAGRGLDGFVLFAPKKTRK